MFTGVYIPAYMIWSLQHYRVSDSFVVDATIYTFDLYGKNPELREYKLERFRLLNLEQSQAVCQFLRFMATNEEYVDARIASVALDEFWGRFCESSVL